MRKRRCAAHPAYEGIVSKLEKIKKNCRKQTNGLDFKWYETKERKEEKRKKEKNVFEWLDNQTDMIPPREWSAE